MMKSYVSYSDDPDTGDAIDALLAELDQQLDGARPAAAILFAGIDFDHQLILDRICDHFRDVELIGCTTTGEMTAGMGFGKDSLVLTLLVADDVEIHSGSGVGLSRDVTKAAADAVQEARAKMKCEPALCITLPDSLTASGSAIIEALNSALGDNFPVVGATAGDYVKFKRTLQFHNNKVLTDGIPVLLLGGNLMFGHGFASGWKPVGRKGRVTGADGSSVHAIDDTRATDFYLSYIPSLERPNEYPMAIYDGAEAEKFYLRSPVVALPDTGEMRFFGDVPVGATVQCTMTTNEEVLGAVQEAMTDAAEMYPGKNPSLALLFSCGGRHMYLGTRTGREFDEVLAHFDGALPPVAGFYSYGEIAPLSRGTKSRFHNTTFVVLLLGQN